MEAPSNRLLVQIPDRYYVISAEFLLMLNKFLEASKAFNLTISLSKTEALYQPTPDTTSVEPNMSIDDTPLANADSFNYLAWTVPS